MGFFGSAFPVIILIPLCGAILSFLCRYARKRLAGPIATASAVLAFFTALEMYSAGAVLHWRSDWINIGKLVVPFSFTLDSLSTVMCLIITGVGSLIHIFSIGYMEEDSGIHRFFAYLNLFLAAMLVLVLGDSLPVVFIGWEGVGLCSYLLIGFWFTNSDYAKAGQKAFVMNRIGDLGFLFAIMVLFWATGSVEISGILSSLSSLQTPALTMMLAAAGLLLAATGKSAQIPLFTWLPDAMAGPTPVSALIHAATMVTAGIYLLARMHPILDAAPDIQDLTLIIAVLTALVAGVTALFQFDIKKVLAYSTVSQLGLMFMAVGVGAYQAAMFHVVTHAFFKACLFLSAGSVILGTHHEQDMRRMGGLLRSMPFTGISFAVAALALAGIFPFAGYYSKHQILEAVHSSGLKCCGETVYYLGLGVAVLTGAYSARAFCMTFLGKYRGHAHAHEAPPIMVVPVVVLAVLSVIGGWLLHQTLSSYLAPILGGVEVEKEGLITILAGSAPGIIGILIGAFLLSSVSRPSSESSLKTSLRDFAFSAFCFDRFYNCCVVEPLRRTSNLLSVVFERWIIGGAVSGLAAVTQMSGEFLRISSTGSIPTYVGGIIVGVAVLMLLFTGS